MWCMDHTNSRCCWAIWRKHKVVGEYFKFPLLYDYHTRIRKVNIFTILQNVLHRQCKQQMLLRNLAKTWSNRRVFQSFHCFMTIVIGLEKLKILPSSEIRNTEDFRSISATAAVKSAGTSSGPPLSLRPRWPLIRWKEQIRGRLTTDQL